MTSLQSKFLVASPHLTDPNFFRSVVLMVQHDEEGAFGLILNRRTGSSLSDVVGLLSDEECLGGRQVQRGGPVEGPLTAIHTDPACPENELLPGLYFTADKDDLCELARHSKHSLLIFSGYAGWAGGQLESEIDAGGWLTTPATVDDVFSEQADLWNRVSHRIGLEILAPSINSRHVPQDPSLN